MNSKTFCVNPWVTLHSRLTEGFNPCCLFKGVMKYDTVSDYVNSSELASVKHRLLDGEQIPECASCWKQEHIGYVSKRQRDNQQYKNIFQSLNRDLTKSHGRFVEYYLRLGNHCNLRCTSCNDTVSSGWISENKKFNIPTIPVTLLSDEHDVWQHLQNNADTIGVIEFIGGEPFMMSVDKQTSLLKWLVDNNHAKHIRLKYNTNGTRMPSEQVAFWKSFKAIEINVSVDGIGDRFEYLRFPATWETVHSTLGQYREMQQTIPKLELTVISTISVLSIGYIQDILDYCQTENLNLFLNMLDSPPVLNLFNSSSKIKGWIRDRIQHIEHPVIKNVLANLDQTPSTVGEKELLDFLTAIEQRRGLDLRKTFPELAQCLE